MFKVRKLFDPVIKIRERGPLSMFRWWAGSEVEERLHALQTRLCEQRTYHGYSAAGLPSSGGENDGMACTLTTLWELREEPQKQVELLRAGVLFFWTHSSRGGRQWRQDSRYWPSQSALRLLYECSLLKAGIPSPWRYVHTEVVPSTYWMERDGRRLDVNSKEDLRDIADFSGVVDSEVNMLIKHWQPLVLTFDQEGEPALRMRVEAELAVLNAKRDTDAAVFAARQAENARVLAELKSVHPRFGEWGNVPAAELEGLAWSKPLREVAADFGVSDVAVKKACKVRGIATPPRGYWLRRANV